MYLIHGEAVRALEVLLDAARLDESDPLALEVERVISHEVAITDIARLPRLIDDYVAQIVAIGMSPMKAFA